jgi:hypothetical protein
VSSETAAETILDYPREVTDEAGFVHRLEPKPLGIGGQGVVFRTTERDLAVKLAADPFGRPVREGDLRDRLYRQLDQVRTLPLPELKIAQPLQLLARPYAGYVMRLLTDMKPACRLFLCHAKCFVSREGGEFRQGAQAAGRERGLGLLP